MKLYKRNHSLYIVESMMIEFSRCFKIARCFFFWNSQKQWNLSPQNANMCCLCPIRGCALIPIWCVTEAEYGLCDAKIIVVPQLQSMKHSQSQFNQQTDAQAHKTYKEKTSCFFDGGGWWTLPPLYECPTISTMQGFRSLIVWVPLRI